MKRFFFFILMSLQTHLFAQAWGLNDGQVVYGTSNGVVLQYRIVSDEEKTVEVVGAPSTYYLDVYDESQQSYVRNEEKQDLNRITSITVPAVVDGYRVVATAEEAFRLNQYIEDEDISFTIISCSCPNLANITFPEGMLHLGKGALTSQKNLTSVTLPQTLESMGEYCMNNCSSLSQIDLPESLKDIGQGCLTGCEALTELTIPLLAHGGSDIDFVKSIDFCAGCPNLKTLRINCKDAAWVFAIHRQHGYDNEGQYWENPTLPICVENIILGPEVEKIAYDYSTPGSYINLKSIRVSEDNPTFDSRDNSNAIIRRKNNCLVYGANTTVIPASVTSIGDGAFRRRELPEEYTVPEGIQSVGTYSFSETAMRRIQLPSSCTYIGGHAFQNCLQLDSIALPSEGSTLHVDVFAGCSSLKTLTFPQNTRCLNPGYLPALDSVSIGVGCDIGGFYAAENLRKVYISDCPWHYEEDDDRGVYIVQDNPYRFHAGGIDSHKLQGIRLGEGGILEGFFEMEHVEHLTSINIPDGCSIGDHCFKECPNLKTVEMNAVVSIGQGAFYECTSLECVTLPASLRRIGTSAFGSCTSLKKVTSYVKRPFYCNRSFQLGDYSAPVYPDTLYVPFGTKYLYEELPDWNLFGEIIEMPEDVEGIANTYVTPPERMEVYSLSGTRLKEPLRGFNIVNGRKVIVRK